MSDASSRAHTIPTVLIVTLAVIPGLYEAFHWARYVIAGDPTFPGGLMKIEQLGTVYLCIGAIFTIVNTVFFGRSWLWRTALAVPIGAVSYLGVSIFAFIVAMSIGGGI